jgi:hypothetical protein
VAVGVDTSTVRLSLMVRLVVLVVVLDMVEPLEPEQPLRVSLEEPVAGGLL